MSIFLRRDRYQKKLSKNLKQAAIEGLPENAEMHANQALQQDLDPLDCINDGLTPGIKRVGELFASEEYFLPELIFDPDVMKAGLRDRLKIMVGGALVTASYVYEIGADRYDEEAISEVDLAFRLVDAPRQMIWPSVQILQYCQTNV
ncbi:B12-binding domain-containing protein [Chloroflexota bacterium]